jgi:hypothetical protein
VIENTVSLTPSNNPKRLRSVLLAHVVAHEMGHLLLGSAKHGDGIMTSSFGLNAIRQACTGRLPFSRTDSGKILATVQRMNEAAYAFGEPAMSGQGLERVASPVAAVVNMSMAAQGANDDARCYWSALAGLHATREEPSARSMC